MPMDLDVCIAQRSFSEAIDLIHNAKKAIQSTFADVLNTILCGVCYESIGPFIEYTTCHTIPCLFIQTTPNTEGDKKMREGPLASALESRTDKLINTLHKGMYV